MEVYESYKLVPDSEGWKNLAVNCIDYITTPSLLKKNNKIITYFINDYIPKMEMNKTLFEDVKLRISKLREVCYSYEQKHHEDHGTNNLLI